MAEDMASSGRLPGIDLGGVVNLRTSVSKLLFSSFPRKRESRIRYWQIHICCQWPLDSRLRGNDGEYDDTP